MLALLVMAAATVCGAQDDFTVLDEQTLGFPADEMLKRHLDAKANEYLAARKERFEALKTPDDIQQYQDELRSFFVEALGGFPERTPLNPRIVGQGEGEGFRYEKVIFESQPGYYVTAVLYLPRTEPPYPGVLLPCGHSDNGKAAETYQRASMLLAQNGCAVLCYDPIGQGERYDFLQENGKPLFGTTLQHTVMGVPAILTGTNIAMFRIYDGIRALDYLASRPEIDAERLGCTGNSGGGTLTSYIMALDERVAVAAPSCYLTSFERLLATIGPQDAEQDIFGQIRKGLNHADYIHLRAPKPTLMCAATNDFFDIAGTWDTFREAKRLYTKLGYPERVSLVEADEKHGFTQPLREGAASWMKRWLLEEDVSVKETAAPIFSDADLQCTPEGQVLHMDGARRFFDLIQDRYASLKAQRPTLSPEDLRTKILNLIDAESIDAIDAPASEEKGAIERNSYTIHKLILKPREGVVIPALDFRPAGEPTRTILYCHGEGKEAAARADAETLVQEGARVFAVDLRGLGETRSKENMKDWSFFAGSDWTDYFRAYLIGKSMVGMRVEDIFACMKHLDTPQVELIGVGEATVPVLHAAALAPGHVGKVTLRAGIPSWEAVLQIPDARQQLSNCVHNALAVYDLPDLVQLAGAEKVTQQEMSVPQFMPPK
jgi:dienelactone hydrolase